MAERLRVLVLNQISPQGLSRLPDSRYLVGPDVVAPDAILVRSADLHKLDIPASVRAIGRAGAGTNNIPVAALSGRGIPVFNAPGANANAVKELVVAGMLLAARNLPEALAFVADLEPQDPDMAAKVEAGKRTYAGIELAGRTLGIIGLGRIGCLVADAAIRLGMAVQGFDPEITVAAAWSLPAGLKRADSVADVLKRADFVSLHVPLLPATRDLVNAGNVGMMKPEAVLLNFSRQGVVDDRAVAAALAAGALGRYVCDFPSAALGRQSRVIALPHLGASTVEAEESCALMVAEALRDYLEHGNVNNSVNFPNLAMTRESDFRVAIVNANVPNMLGQISTAMAKAGLNIHNMMNKSRAGLAYTLVDVDSPVPPPTIAAIAAIDGVLAVRYLPQEA